MGWCPWQYPSRVHLRRSRCAVNHPSPYVFFPCVRSMLYISPYDGVSDRGVVCQRLRRVRRRLAHAASPPNTDRARSDRHATEPRSCTGAKSAFPFAGMSGTTSSKVFGTDGGAEGSGSCLGPASPGPYHGSWLKEAREPLIPGVRVPSCPPAVRGTSCLGRRGRARLQLTLGRVQAVGDGATEQGLALCQ